MTKQKAIRKPSNADLWAAIRGCHMMKDEIETLRQIYLAHFDNPAYASQVLASAAQQVFAMRYHKWPAW